MTAREQGFLLLTGHLADPQRKPLTIAQLRLLARRVQAAQDPAKDRELAEEDLIALGYDRMFAHHVICLLNQTDQLQWYLEKGKRSGCCPITRLSAGYPHQLRKRLGWDAPGALWVKGDISILQAPAVALVGSRDLLEKNRQFAYEVGKQAALQGYVLVSGDARGADRTAQNSCLAHGGRIVSVVADRLEAHPAQERVVYVSEDGFDIAFSAQRALQRNRIIHSLGNKTFVAQCALRKGGTWDGTQRNLRYGWSPVFCFQDGSCAGEELAQMGATRIGCKELENIQALQTDRITFIDQ